MDKSLIQIFRGDDTDGLGYQSIQGKITTTLDLTGCRAVFRYLGFTQEFDPIPENGRITITIPASKTSKFPPGLGYASLRVYDSEGKVRTFTNRIPVFVTVYAPSECGGEFEVVFNGGNLELEPLKIKSVNGYRIYDGYLEQIIDKATATEYGLALLFDGRDNAKDTNSGYAATPKAVQAAYDAVIQELTDNYYNAEETEEAIDRIAAYYITADAQGNPFATHAALMGATEFYSGGQRRIPTRNDYCVVLADETHDGRQYRYIYATNQQGVGQWEAQYAVGGSIELDNTVTRTSTNGVKSSGIWSAIWGELLELPGVSSLYDWCVAALAGKVPTSRTVNGKALTGNVTLTGADIAVSGTDATKIDAELVDLVEQIYDAVKNIAPEFTAQSYALNELCTYNGVVYRCKSAYTATAQSAKPNSDTTHWEAKKVSELFLPWSNEFVAIELPNESGILAVIQNVADEYDNTKTYELHGLCVHNGFLYYCTTAITTPEEWTNAHWISATIEDVLALLRYAIAERPTLDIVRNFFAPKSSPAFTGTPTAPTPASGDNSTKVATTAFVKTAIGGITPGPDNTKLDSTSAAPAFSTSSTYAAGEHVTYNGKLYKCTTAVTVAGAWDASKWTADTMTDPDAVLDITSQNQLRVVAKDGTLLWAQGYDLASTSSATLACDAANNFTFADGATTQAFALPTAPTGKVGDFILDIDNSANSGAATMTLTGLDTTFSLVVPKGESLTDMLAFAAGELSRFYITLTSFRVNNLPTWHIVKQVVENGGATV